jgi:hypothetical protein
MQFSKSGNQPSFAVHSSGFSIIYGPWYVPTPGLHGAQKDETDAQKAKQAEVEEAQKKIAEIMVKAQEEVRSFCHDMKLETL